MYLYIFRLTMDIRFAFNATNRYTYVYKVDIGREIYNEIIGGMKLKLKNKFREVRVFFFFFF